MGRLDGKTIVITGGARGIGRGCALVAVNEGATVVITDVNEERGRQTEEVIRRQGEGFYFHQDVLDEVRWDALFEEVFDAYGAPDVVVNNVGAAILKPMADYPLETLHFMLRMNIEACFMGTQRAMRLMAANGGGSIINMSSVAGIKGGPNGTAYSAGKGGMTQFTKAAAIEGKPLGIRVNSVHPGIVPGPVVRERMGEEEAARFEARIVDRTPLKMVGTPGDIAGMVVFLASDESAHVTGAEMVLDGGYSRA